jgi:hypothetical protein
LRPSSSAPLAPSSGNGTASDFSSKLPKKNSTPKQGHPPKETMHSFRVGAYTVKSSAPKSKKPAPEHSAFSQANPPLITPPLLSNGGTPFHDGATGTFADYARPAASPDETEQVYQQLERIFDNLTPEEIRTSSAYNGAVGSSSSFAPPDHYFIPGATGYTEPPASSLANPPFITPPLSSSGGAPFHDGATGTFADYSRSAASPDETEQVDQQLEAMFPELTPEEIRIPSSLAPPDDYFAPGATGYTEPVTSFHSFEQPQHPAYDRFAQHSVNTAYPAQQGQQGYAEVPRPPLHRHLPFKH